MVGRKATKINSNPKNKQSAGADGKELFMKKQIRRIALVLAVVLVGGMLAGCAKKPIAADQVVMRVNGTDVTMQTYRYYYLSLKEQYDSGDSSYWTNHADEEAELKATADQVLLQNMAYDVFLREQGYTATDADRAAVDQQIESIIEYYGSDESFQKALTAAYTTEEAYREMALRYRIIYRYLYDYNREKYADEMDRYIRVKHVLVKVASSDDSDGHSDEEALAIARQVAQEARDGADFDELVEKYGEDPGMVDNLDGYYFTDNGSMVAEFEEASFALQEGEISDPVKSKHGYHVILRLPVEEEYLISNFESIFSDDMYYEDFFDTMDEVVESLKVEYTKTYEKISVKTVQ